MASRFENITDSDVAALKNTVKKTFRKLKLSIKGMLK